MTCTVTPEDQLAILDLFARYAWAYDDGDAETYAAAFTPDGILAEGDDVLGVGREGIKHALTRFVEQRGSDIWRHYNDQHLFEGGQNKVRIRSYWMVIGTDPSGASFVLGQGRYVTDVEWHDGQADRTPRLLGGAQTRLRARRSFLGALHEREAFRGQSCAGHRTCGRDRPHYCQGVCRGRRAALRHRHGRLRTGCLEKRVARAR